MPDEHAHLREAPLAPLDPEGARGESPTRRHRVVLVALVVVVVAAGVGVGVAHRRGADRPAADVTIHRDAPPATAQLILQNPVPPAEGAPLPRVATGALRHSGGPYLSRARVAAMVLAQLECTIGKPRRGMPGFTCARIDVAFFDRYADALTLRGASWVNVPQWAPDREMYAVTVWGHLTSDTSPAVTEITTVLIDATTGRTMMEGGPPLPAADANRELRR
jgi:hypothetical protein